MLFLVVLRPMRRLALLLLLLLLLLLVVLLRGMLVLCRFNRAMLHPPLSPAGLPARSGYRSRAAAARP